MSLALIMPPAPRNRQDPTRLDPAFMDWIDRLIQSVATPTSIGYVPSTRTITAGTGLSGGGDLSANRTIAVAGNLATLYALANASGFLKNDGAGVLSYAQPAASDLTGNTLAAGVTASSLTSLGTLTSLTMAGAITGVTGLTMASGQIVSAGGSAAAPGVGVGAANQGLYDLGANRIGLALNGLVYYTFRTTGLAFNNSTAYALADSSGNEFVKFASVASAINEVTITNAASGTGPTISSTSTAGGGDASVDLNFATKGSGQHKFTGQLLASGRVQVGSTSGITSARLRIAGNDSTGSPWGLNGALLRIDAMTYTDTASSGTVAAAVGSGFGVPTWAASNVTTFTDAATLYIAGAPAAGTNVTLTNAYALWVDAGNVRFDGNLDLADATGEYRINGTKVVDARITGWTAWTGTAARTGFDTATATTANIAETLKALIDDLTSHGLIGA